MEIERKWLLPRSFDLLGVEGLEDDYRRIRQGYILGDKDAELRVRMMSGGIGPAECFITFKGTGDLCREEWEESIPESVFRALYAKTEGRRIDKIRYVAVDGANRFEIDVFKGDLEGLILLECEFGSEEAARTVQLPKCFADAVDVTVDKRFKNKNLAADPQAAMAEVK